MRAWYCAAGLLVSCASAYSEESPPLQTLTILFQFERPHPERALMEAQRQLAVLIKDAGVRLAWRDRAGPQGNSSFPNILMLDFVGNCDPRSENKLTGEVHGWLARMHVSNGVVLPFGEVNCDLVRAVLNGATHRGVPKDVVFGRALARVLAHELYHFITQSTGHLEGGLAKPSLSRKDLALDSFKLNHEELNSLSTNVLQ